MTRYLLRRLLFMIFVVLGVITIVFLFAHLVPSDPARVALGPDATKEMVENYRRERGLDQPILVQYAIYLQHLATGDLGTSIVTRRPVATDLAQFVPATIELMIPSLIISTVLGFGSFGPRPLQIAMRVPVLGGCLQTAALSRFAWTLSLTLDAGVDAVRSLSLALRSTQNAYYTAHTAATEKAIVAGREFHEALRETGAFPDDFLASLETAELAGKPGETLQRLANEYRDRAKAAARILAIAAAFAVWAAVAALLIVLIFRLFFMAYAPLFELERELHVR